MNARLRKLSVVVSLSVLLLVAFSGIMQAQKIQIRFANWQFLEPGRDTLLYQFIEEFEAQNPGVEIVAEAIPYSTYNERIANELRAGQGPDVFFSQEFSIIPWIQDGFVAPLDDLIDLAKYDFLPQQSSAIYNGGPMPCSMKASPMQV